MKLRIPYWQFLFGPLFLYYIGAAMNMIVMAMNHGQMPVQVPPFVTQDMMDDGHSIMTSATHLKFLCDWINLHVVIMSPGDLLLMFGDKFEQTGAAIWAALMIKDRQ